MCPLMMKVLAAFCQVTNSGNLTLMKLRHIQLKRRRNVLLQRIVSRRKDSIWRLDNMMTTMTQEATTPRARWMTVELSRYFSWESSKAISIWQLIQQPPHRHLWSKGDPNSAAMSLTSLRRPRETRSSLTGLRSLARNALSVLLASKIARGHRKCLTHLGASYPKSQRRRIRSYPGKQIDCSKVT